MHITRCGAGRYAEPAVPTACRVSSRSRPRPAALKGPHDKARWQAPRKGRTLQHGANRGPAMALTAADLRVIRQMPLHAVTAQYGEEGLRSRLLAEAGQLTGEDPARDVAAALDLAARLHRDDRRQREPYLNHLLRVTLRIICHYGILDPEVALAALLHDSVEDHAAGLSPAGGRDGALAVLAGWFGPRVTALVGAVTNPPWTPGADKHEQYRAHVTALLRDGDPHAGVIKLADFTDYAGWWIMPIVGHLAWPAWASVRKVSA